MMTRSKLALHEAGHAVMGVLQGRVVDWVSIVGQRDTLGRCVSDPPPHPAVGTGRRPYVLRPPGQYPKGAELEGLILTLMGGMAAEVVETGGYDWDAAASDREKAVGCILFGRIVSVDEAPQQFQKSLEQATDILLQHWTKVQAVAAALEELDTLSGEEVRELMYPGRAQKRTSRQVRVAQSIGFPTLTPFMEAHL